MGGPDRAPQVSAPQTSAAQISTAQDMSREAVWRKLADDLLLAGTTRAPIAPPTEVYDWLTVDDAYAVQLLQVESLVASGARIVGHKVGLTSAAMQAALGVDQPDFGHLLDHMVLPEGQPISARRLLAPRVEPEIAFVLGRELAGPGITVADCVRAVDVVMPCFEVIDSRIEDWRIALVDTVADNASSAAVVLAARPYRLHELDLRDIPCTLSKNGRPVQFGTGAAVLGNPLNALAWLANTLGARGAGLPAGDIVLPGAMTAAVPVAAGDHIEASFGPLGHVTAFFN
ncbi:fumarylacetoacetate hydrolase family protein [Sphaerisporangium sp. NPDC088356]|uniref:2-keto-4-pentenoate hydratase n=1 Tax=Sphaerisporangium sp. NPDC088356 TaxID=3154871 RepID=UPI0034135578